MKKEIWKPIIGYESNYIISNFGQVKNIKTGKILKGDINNAGYKRITLFTPIKKRFFVHRLVAMHFVKGFDVELVVNHIDGNKLNNNADNLEWVTRSENDLHAYQNNLRHIHCPYINGGMYYQVFDLTNGALIKEYSNQKEICTDYNIDKQTIRAGCVRGWLYKDWHCKKLGKIGIKRCFR